MGEYFTMPKLDMSMKSGTIVAWLVNVGDYVATGENVIEIETGKVSIEVESTAPSGYCLARYFEEGDTLEVGVPLMFIGELDEETPEYLDADLNHNERVQDQDVYDSVVIGGGPAGYSFAMKASLYNKRVAIVEADLIGGTCVNRGCIPVKSMINHASVLETVLNAAKLGITFENLTSDFGYAKRHMDEVSSKLRDEMRSSLTHSGVSFINQKASIEGPGRVALEDGRVLSCEQIVIATGSSVDKSRFMGIENVAYDEEMIGLTKVPSSLLISRSDTIGIEMAFVFSTYGSDVTILSEENHILKGADEEISTILETQMRGKGIRVIKNVTLVDFDGETGQLSNGQTIGCELLLACESRRPVLPQSSVELKRSERGFIAIDDHFSSSVNGIYAIGDVTGKMFTSQSATKQGSSLAEVLYDERKDRVNYDAIPICIYSPPEVAWLGMTEKQAKEMGISVKVSKKSFSTLGRALADDQSCGFVKVLVDPRWDEIIGVHIIGANAADIIAEAAIAINTELCASDIAATSVAHPSFSEAFMSACDEATSSITS
jgi:dihydrolipoamide dehydrogenase